MLFYLTFYSPSLCESSVGDGRLGVEQVSFSIVEAYEA